MVAAARAAAVHRCQAAGPMVGSVLMEIPVAEIGEAELLEGP